MKGELFDYNIKRHRHDEPSEYNLQIIPRDFFCNARTNQNTNHGAQRKPQQKNPVDHRVGITRGKTKKGIHGNDQKGGSNRFLHRKP